MRHVFAFLRKRCLRFRLRSLLLMIVMVSLLAGWLSERARRQGQAVAIVRSYGVVWYEEPSEQLLIGPIQTCAAKLLGDDFAYRVVRVRVDADRVDDLSALDELSHIESADIGGNTLNGTVLADLMTRMPDVRELWIWNPGRLSADDLLCLRRATQLQDLTIFLWHETGGEALLRKVAELRHLRSLGLNCLRLTDSMVQDLSKATTLEGLSVATEQKSPTEIQRVQDALPGCKVVECDTY
jgi:hypothetical protein